MLIFKKRTKEDVKSKKKFFGKGKKADGKKRQLGVTVTFNDGETVTLLNPSGKATKYAAELRDGKRYTNDGKVKVDRNGQEMPLTAEQKAYRSAYIQALSDSAKAYNAAKAKGGDK
ncbi:MAG: hypothetical protein K2K38_04945 [Clostridia bacterium]|nr:hypothetical protein [Clostridia bacterium]